MNSRATQVRVRSRFWHVSRLQLLKTGLKLVPKLLRNHSISSDFLKNRFYSESESFLAADSSSSSSADDPAAVGL